jgi:hypothetical protein
MASSLQSEQPGKNSRIAKSELHTNPGTREFGVRDLDGYTLAFAERE